MAYSDFSLREVLEAFGLTLREHPDLFGTAAAVEPGETLQLTLRHYLPLALAINTEKARSEWIIAPILGDVRLRLEGRISLFSGTALNVDPARGLQGFCDFILSRSPIQHLLQAPALMVAEAKNLDLVGGLGQCIAAMVGAREFNAREGHPLTVVHGAVTRGDQWEFLKLEEDVVTLDMRVYAIQEVTKILGVLVQIMTQ
jgi:hypothetical protein